MGDISDVFPTAERPAIIPGTDRPTSLLHLINNAKTQRRNYCPENNEPMDCPFA